MMNDKLYLTPGEILEKDFKVDARGYRMQEVDKYLDMIIRDYTEFLRMIKKLEQDNLHLIEDNKKLQAEYRALKMHAMSTAEETGGSASNLDVIKRISSLEKIVYGREE